MVNWTRSERFIVPLLHHHPEKPHWLLRGLFLTVLVPSGASPCARINPNSEVAGGFILNTAVGYQFFTAKAQRSQRNAELCMWGDRKVGKPMELLGSPNG
jgi:hypothetical protein